MRTLVPFLLLSFLPLWLQFQLRAESKPVVTKRGASATDNQTTPASQQRPTEDKTTSQTPVNSTAENRTAQTKADEELNINRQLAWFTGALVIVGALQMFALIWQARVLNHHSGLIEQSVEQMRRAVVAYQGFVQASHDMLTLTRESNEITARATELTRQSVEEAQRYNVATEALMRESAVAGTVAATAADTSAKALVDGERGWVLVERIEPPQENDIQPPVVQIQIPYFVYRLRLFGKTPCKILNAGMRFHLANINELEPQPEPDLPDEPKYFSDIRGNNLTGKSGDIPCSGQVLAPRERVAMGKALESGSLTKEDVHLITDSKRFLCAYGFVSYKDAYSRDHETRFCYVYRISTSALMSASTGQRIDPSRFRIGGPVEYNKQT